MIEVRYDTNTHLITGWWGSRYGNHPQKLSGRPFDSIVELNIYIPPLPPEAYCYYPPNDNLSVNPDYSVPFNYHARAQQLLSTSPDVITQPEIWELLRIYGRLLGCYPEDIDT